MRSALPVVSILDERFGHRLDFFLGMVDGLRRPIPFGNEPPVEPSEALDEFPCVGADVVNRSSDHGVLDIDGAPERDASAEA